MQLADSQEREAQLGDRVIEAERKLTACREQQRTLERQAQEATFSQRSLEARRAELNRSIETATQQATALATSSSAPATSWPACPTLRRRAACSRRWTRRWSAKRPWPPSAANTTT
jgi:small-conductance mechanosensitive channel